MRALGAFQGQLAIIPQESSWLPSTEEMSPMDEQAQARLGKPSFGGIFGNVRRGVCLSDADHGMLLLRRTRRLVPGSRQRRRPAKPSQSSCDSTWKCSSSVLNNRSNPSNVPVILSGTTHSAVHRLLGRCCTSHQGIAHGAADSSSFRYCGSDVFRQARIADRRTCGYSVGQEPRANRGGVAPWKVH